MFPGAQRMNRGNHEVKALVHACKANNVSDLVIVHETRGQPGMDCYSFHLFPVLVCSVIFIMYKNNVIFQFFFFNKSAKMSTILCFSVNMECCVYINEEKK